MELLVLIPALLVFLFMLYRFVKDDYIFIRKGISLEQAFDMSFITLWVSLFFARLFDLIFHYTAKQNLLIQFFSANSSQFSLVGAIIGGIIVVFMLSKQRRVPLGRLSDFFSLAFLYALPVGLLGHALFVSKNELLYLFLNIIIYFVVLLFFAQFLFPKLMNRTLKEGMISILFLLTFSVITLTTSFLTVIKHPQLFISLQNAMTFLLLFFSLFLLIKENASPNRRSLNRS